MSLAPLRHCALVATAGSALVALAASGCVSGVAAPALFGSKGGQRANHPERVVLHDASFKALPDKALPSAIVSIARCDFHDQQGEIQEGFFVASEGGATAIFDPQMNRIAPLALDLGQRPSVRVDQECSQVAVAQLNRQLRIVDLQRGAELTLTAGRVRARVTALEFAEDNRSLLLGVADGSVYRWRFAEERESGGPDPRGRFFERYAGHGSVVSAAAYHPGGRLFFSGDWLGAIIAWQPYDADAHGGQFDQNIFGSQFYLDGALRSVRAAGAGNVVEDLAVSADGQRVFVTFQHGMLEWWDIRGFVKRAEVAAHRGVVFAVDLQPQGDEVVTVGRDGMVRRWRPVREERPYPDPPLYRLELQREVAVEGAQSLAWLDTERVIVGTKRGAVRIVDLSPPAAAPGT